MKTKERASECRRSAMASITILRLAVMVMPTYAYSANDVQVINGTNDARFFPLTDVRASEVTHQHGVTIIHEKKSLQAYRSDSDMTRSDSQGYSSDSQASDKGVMRADNADGATVFRRFSPLIIHPSEATASTVVGPQKTASLNEDLDENTVEDVLPESDAIAGLNETNDPVLALFDSGGEVGKEPLSFAQAMKGRRNDGLWLWPIPSSAKQMFSSAYGPRKDPFHGHMAFHGGIDIAADAGTPVVAVADGEVIEVQTDAGFGNYVGIKLKDGTVARYGHLSQQDVRQGQRVRAGQTIGAVGKSGRATGSHLDFRVSRNGVRFDPLAVLNIPSTISLDGVKIPPVAAQSVRPRIASNAPPRRPMVIKVSD